MTGLVRRGHSHDVGGVFMLAFIGSLADPDRK